MKLTTITFLLLALTSTKTFACGNGECDPEPEPPKTVIQEQRDVDPTYSHIYYSICTCDKMKVAWGFESLEFRTAKARSQCEIRRTEKLECPEKWK